MKTSFNILIIFFTLSCSLVSEAKDLKSKEVSFDEILIRGKSHFSDEVIVTVEDEKVLNALLAVPKDFKTRVKKSSFKK